VPDGAVSNTLATPDAPNLPYSATPGGPAVGHLIEHWGGPATRPVLDQQNGWVQVRLASRPNGSSGWVPLQNVTLTTTPYRIVVSICQRSVTLFQGAAPVYSAPVGVGRPQWPTPVGPSFVDSIVKTPARQQYIYGPTVLILGTHSNVFTEFDGGDGTVAIHGYPSDPGSTKGVMSSHGCVRSGPDTINAIKVVPVGTPVDVIA
jgi:lipoprotein-anchoring transpeptidase ErfK/SrfK